MCPAVGGQDSYAANSVSGDMENPLQGALKSQAATFRPRLSGIRSLPVANLDPAAKMIKLYSVKWLNKTPTKRKVVTLLQALYNTVSWNPDNGKAVKTEWSNARVH